MNMINPISKTNSFHAKEKFLREKKKKKTERKKKKGSEYQTLIAKVSEHQKYRSWNYISRSF